MATTASLLTKVETAIENLLDAIDADAVQEYRIGNRIYKRADFGRVLDSLLAARDKLKARAGREATNPLRVGKLGPARVLDR